MGGSASSNNVGPGTCGLVGQMAAAVSAIQFEIAATADSNMETANGPMQANDARRDWRLTHSLGSPAPPATPKTGISTRRSIWSPVLERQTQQMADLLNRPRDTPQTIAAPPPDAAGAADGGIAIVPEKLSELTVGVAELRANQAPAVTRDVFILRQTQGSRLRV